MGELLRRYWHVIGAASELDKEPVQRVRLLGENLTLFRSESGEYGLVDEVCPHRCMAMEYGIPQKEGLRCAYHGWLWAPSGQCLEQPYEETVNPQARFKDKVRIKAYPVQELGGLVFAYMGPAPAPLLPRWDLLVRDDLDAMVEIRELPCNWLQCMDNSMDPIHFEHLHGVFGNYHLNRLGREPAMVPAKHVKIGFDRFEYGIMKRRLLEGEPEDIDDWQIGHPVLFPNTLAVGEEHRPMLQIRIPTDDTTTLHLQYVTKQRDPNSGPKHVPVHRDSLYNEQGKIIADSIPKQDELAWVGQGPLTDRTREHLGVSDTGIILFRKIIEEQLEKIERGEDPIGVIRDRAINEPFIRIRRERVGYQAFQSQYEPVADVQRALAAAGV